jgi:O-antigen/teichoic acid export membrane protein
MAERHERGRLVANTLATTVAQLSALAIAFVLAPFLIRAFGSPAYGGYMLAASVAAFTLLLDLGLGAAVEKLLAEYVAAERRADAGALLATVGAAYLGVGVLVCAIDFALAAAAARVFHVGSVELPVLQQLLRVAGIGALLWWPLSVGARALGGLQRYTHVAAVTAAMAVANAVAAVAVVVTGRGPVVLAIASNAVSIAGAALMLLLARRQLAERGVPAGSPSRAALRAAFAFSGPVFVLQLAVQVLYHNTDRILLGMFVGSVAVTLYEGPARFVALLVQLTGFGNTALMPFASQLEATRRDDTLAALLVRGSRYVSAFVAPLALLLAVLARPLLVTWLGPAFAAAELPAVLLTALQVLLVSLTVGHTVVVATGKLPGRLPVILAIVTLNVVLSVLLVRPYGMTGVAFATVVAALIDYPLHLRYLVRHAGLKPAAFVREVVLPVYPLLLLPAAAAVAARMLGITATLAGTLTTFAFCALLYWMVFLGVMVGRAERDALIETARGLLSRRATVAR